MTIPIAQKQARARFNLLRPFLQLPGILKFVLKRLFSNFGLTLIALVNIILAVGLVNNASFFSEAVDRVVLQQELKAFSVTTGRPPLSTSVYVFPSDEQPLSLSQAEQLSKHITQTLSGEIGLPVRQQILQMTSVSLMLQPAKDSTLFTEGKNYLGNYTAVYRPGISTQMQIVEGSPIDEGGQSVGALDIWIHESTAQNMGVHIGEKLRVGLTIVSEQIPVRVAGIWRAKDPKSEYWWTNPDSGYQSSFIVRKRDYVELVQPLTKAGSSEVSWYVILDEKSILPRNGQQYLNGFKRSLQLIEKYLSGARMDTPPLDPLSSFVNRSSTLTVLLLGYNLPAFAILLNFLMLSAAIISRWQRRETSMLVSRGLSVSGVLSITLLEQIILFVIGYPLGVLLGMFIAWAMGFTASFLAFTPRDPLPLSMEGLSLPLTLLALAISLVSRVGPTLRSARSSLTIEEHERARPVNRPFWYRTYLDIILLLPTFYVYDQMVKRGSLAGLVSSKPEDLYRDPLLIVVPALFILTISLVTMRIFAVLMRLIDLVAGRIPWLTLHLALRQLGRQSLEYVQPLLLVLISLAMGVYTISMAASLDQWTLDRFYYQTGADYTFTPTPNTTPGIAPLDGEWTPPPRDFLRAPGVQAAARVGKFNFAIDPDTDKELRGLFIAIDRIDFPQAAWYREDFAGQPLGGLMNSLASFQNAILVSQDFLNERQLQVGDLLTINVSIEGITKINSEFTIAGTYTYFPTVYPDHPTIIGNLDDLTTLAGITPPHDLWMKLKPGADTQTLPDQITQVTMVVPARVTDTRQLITHELSQMERVGIFGTLSIGFLSTALMAMLGLLIYSYASLQERAYRLAVLNAVGLSRRQILFEVVLEFTFLALFGAIAGALIGLGASNLFVPFFRYTGGKGVPLPPIIPIIAGDRIQTLSLGFCLAIVGMEVMTIFAFLRGRLVQILKRVWL